ncbi:dihydrodipicolinate synthase [Bdellovibrio bacteriovorus W]|nr:dihydrodipicolinate synthase [Bdellovibrio bacteriovorus W]
MSNLKGTFTALITPFKNGQIDFESLEKLIQFQLKNGVDGFVINGTTAESPTLEKSEVSELFKFARKVSGPNVPLIVGTGSNSTAQTMKDSRQAQEMGADAVLVVVPYYNKPPQRGLEAHFKAVAESISIPVILYNVPGRTITSLESQTISNLAKIENITSIKEASGKIDFANEIIKSVDESFILLSGDDGTYVEFLAAGGHGVISVATHVIPKQMVQWRAWAQAGELDKAREDIKKYSRLIDLLFIEANPIPVKKALELMGIISSAELRLPLMELADSNTEMLRKEMQGLGLV